MNGKADLGAGETLKATVAAVSENPTSTSDGQVAESSEDRAIVLEIPTFPPELTSETL
jgi:hypothetical protein